MAARAIWKGSISFGPVSIPVSLHSAEVSVDLDLDMIDERNHARVKYKRVNARTGKEVPYDKIVKGYQYKKNEYVIITDEDFKKANVKATETIDIEDFVSLEEVDVTYFDKPYYMVPGKGAEKAYALLRQTLEKTAKAGIAKVVLHKKQHLAAVMPKDDMLILEMLRFDHQIKDAGDLQVAAPKKKITAKEAELAEMLVEKMTSPWRPGQYQDTYHDDMMKLIKRKIKTGDTVDEAQEEGAAGPTELPGNLLDLMPLLEEGLKSMGTGHHKVTGKAGKKAAKRTAKRVKHGA